MYTAKVIICLAAIGAAVSCFEVSDKRGPYEAKAGCLSRGAEMVVGINTVINQRGFVGVSTSKIVCSETDDRIG